MGFTSLISLGLRESAKNDLPVAICGVYIRLLVYCTLRLSYLFKPRINFPMSIKFDIKFFIGCGIHCLYKL